jgi:hypothetical protein
MNNLIVEVRTTKDNGSKNWLRPRKGCQWGKEGVIVKRHDSHGLCYDVKHKDGTIACYDPDELELIK